MPSSLGCTEIAMLIAQQDTPVRLLDATVIQAQKAVQLALAEPIGSNG